MNTSDKIEKVTEDKYLGSIISDSNNNKKKINSAKSKGTGAISTIMAILNDISLGIHYFEIAVLLRETLFINSILWNIETWYNLLESEVEELELIDRMLLKKCLMSQAAHQQRCYI